MRISDVGGVAKEGDAKDHKFVDLGTDHNMREPPGRFRKYMLLNKRVLWGSNYLPTNPKQSPIFSTKYSGRHANSSGDVSGSGRLFDISNSS